MISRASRFITLVVYDREKNAKCFNLDKHSLRAFGLAIPLIFFVTIGLFLLLAIRFKTIMAEIKGQAPEEMVRLKTENEELTKQLSDLQITNKEFENKLSLNITSSPSESHPYLQAGASIAPINGAMDLRGNKPLEIEGLQTVVDSTKVALKFNILNQQAQEKIQGHIIVFLRDAQGIQVYPEANALGSDYLTQFNRGEKFTVARFRPVEAVFQRPPLKSKNLIFKIALLSRTGDILLLQDYGPVENR